MEPTDYCLVNRSLANAIIELQQDSTRNQEAFSNLSRCAGLALPGKIDFHDTFYYLIIAFVGIGLGVFFIILAIYMFFQLDEHFFKNIPVALLVASLGVGFLVSFGHPYLMEAYILVSHSRYIEHIFQEMITRGKVVDGKVLVTTQTSENIQEIKYQFTSIDESEIVEGIYITTVSQSFPPGCRVAVLVLNQNVHILL